MKTKTDEKAAKKVPRKNSSVSECPFKFVENSHNKKLLEGKFQTKLQTATCGTQHTVTTEDGKLIHRIHILGPIGFQKKRKPEWAPQFGDKITPKNRHCLRGVDGKYIQWNEILSDILNRKLKIIKSRTRKSDTELESKEEKIGDQDESNSGTENPDMSERNGFKPITTEPEDRLKLHTDRELHTVRIETKN